MGIAAFFGPETGNAGNTETEQGLGATATPSPVPSILTSVQAAIAQQEEDAAAFQSALAAALKQAPNSKDPTSTQEMDVSGELMALIMLLMSGPVQQQGDQINHEAAVMSVINKLGQTTAGMTQDFNTIASSAPGSQAATNAVNDLQQKTQQLNTWLGELKNSPLGVQVLSSSVGQGLSTAIGSLENQIGVNGNDWSNVATTIQGWSSGAAGGNSTDMQNYQQANSQLAILTSTTTNASQGGLNQLNQANGVMQQFLSSAGSLGSIYNALNSNINGNMKSN